MVVGKVRDMNVSHLVVQEFSKLVNMYFVLGRNENGIAVCSRHP